MPDPQTIAHPPQNRRKCLRLMTEPLLSLEELDVLHMNGSGNKGLQDSGSPDQEGIWKNGLMSPQES